MVTYHPLPCVLTQHQARKLMSGGTIALKKSTTGHGGQVIHLTGHQMGRLHKGNGMRLHFSGSQLKHNMTHGKGLKDFVVGVAKEGAKRGVDLAKDYAKTAVGDTVKGALSAFPLVGAPAGRLAEKGVHKVLDIAASAAKRKIGKGVKTGGGARKRTGKGIFGSLGSLVQSTGNAIDTVGNRILGTGLYPPGYSAGAGLLPKPIKGVNSNAAGI